MKDKNGLYYYPSPGNHRVRVYVREIEGEVYFRIWKANDRRMWEEHGWVPWEAICRAAEMYAGKNFDPRRAYDIEIARELLEEDAGGRENTPAQAGEEPSA